MRQTKKFFAKMDCLNDMLNFIKDYCLEKDFDSATVCKINLATEEALVNVIRHAYLNEPKGMIELTCEECTDKPGVCILIKDKGRPFNPIEDIDRIKKDHRQRIKDNAIGGYGIFLYIKIMDEVEYIRSREHNMLYLIKYL